MEISNKEVFMEEQLKMNFDKVYIASPFFNDVQLERVKFIEKELSDHGIEYFSPRSVQFYKEDGSFDGEKIFQNDVDQLNNADVIIALLDDKDMGTSFEIGYAHAKGKRIILVLFEEHISQTNIMLACAGPIVNYTNVIKEYYKENTEYRYIKGKDLE